MATIDQLKCKGGRVKGRKKDGGIINITSKKRKKKKYEDGGITKTPFDYGGAAEFITDTGAIAFDEQKARLHSGYDERESPADMMRKSANLDTSKSLLKGVGTGAAIGTAILPGLGTAIGAGAGALISGVRRSIGKKGRDEEIAEATKQWSAGWTNKTASYANQSRYKSGGKIKGKGGSKSDQISMTAEDGSFIVPAENAETGMDIGRTYLGWNDKTTADRKNSGTGIKVSDGELFYTPEEVGVLKYHGINLDELAPKANSEHKMEKGGFIPDNPDIPTNDNWLTVNNFKPITSRTAKLEFKNRGISFTGENFDEELKSLYPDQSFMPYKMEGNKYYKNFPKSFQIGEGGRKTGTWRSYLDTRTGKSINYDDKKKEKFSSGGYQDGTGPPGGTPMSGRKLGSCVGFSDGGWKYDKGTGRLTDSGKTVQYDQEGNEYKIGTSGEFEMMNKGTDWGKDIFSTYSGVKSKKEKDKEGGRKWYDYIPEIAGTLQTLGGAYGLMEAGKKPDLQVSHTLKKLSAETRRLANFGYEPAVLNALNTQIERTRRDVSKAITDQGGSPMEKMGKLQKLLSTTIDKKAGIVMSNAQEKTRKWADVLKVDTLKAGQEFDINKINIADWYKMQDINAGLLSAGISNIVGARQLKDAQDTIRDVGSTSPSFTLKT